MSAHLDSDRQLALFRELIEASGTLQYLLEDEDISHFTTYLANSLVAEREALKKMREHIKQRGWTLTIKESMTRSILARIRYQCEVRVVSV